MKKFGTVLLAIILMIGFSDLLYAQGDKQIFLEIEQAYSVGYDSSSTLTNYAGPGGFYVSLYVSNVQDMLGFDYKIAYDGTKVSLLGFETQVIENFVPVETTILEDAPTGAIVQFSSHGGTGGTATDTLRIAHTLAVSHAGIDIADSATGFLGRITFLADASLTTSDIVHFVLTRSEFAIKNVGQEFAPLSGMNNCSLNDSLVEASQWTPVELVSFGGEAVDNSSIKLTWETASETNNLKFDILRDGAVVGSVKGHGTTGEPQSYSFVDGGLFAGEYSYQLSQVDYDGTATLSDAITVVLGAPDASKLGQNYPNPFNPATTIPFTLKTSGMTKLSVYNILGQEVAVVLDRELPAGVHAVPFNAAGLSSGMYFYKLEANGYSSMKKLVIIR